MRDGGLDGAALKRIAYVTMLIDHITFLFLERTVTADGAALAGSSDVLYALDLTGRAIGRQAFPIFAFFVAEGYVHTRSRGHYLARLAVSTVLSQVPFYLMCCTGPIGERQTPGLNVCATLALGLLAIWLVDVLYLRPAGTGTRPRPAASAVRSPAAPSTRSGAAPAARLTGLPAVRLIVAAAAVVSLCAAAHILNTDYGYTGVITILAFYLLRSRPKTAVLFVWVWLTCSGTFEIFALPGLLLLLQYNGHRDRKPAAAGTGRPGRYGEYFFYPLHMLALWLMRYMLCGY